LSPYLFRVYIRELISVVGVVSVEILSIYLHKLTTLWDWHPPGMGCSFCLLPLKKPPEHFS